SCCVTLVFPQPADTHDTHRCLSGTAVPARIERPSPIQMILPSLLAFSSRKGGLLASHCARPTSTFRACALREHRRPTLSFLFFPTLPSFSPLYPLGESPDCPSLRASNEHSFIVRVLRARRMVWRLPCPLDRGTPLLAMIPAT